MIVLYVVLQKGLNLGAKSSADLSTLFDVGGIIGGILAGIISDVTGMSALTCAGSFLLSFPMVRSIPTQVSIKLDCAVYINTGYVGAYKHGLLSRHH